MEYPKSVNCKGEKYKVKVTQLPMMYMGLCYKDRKEININSSLKTVEEHLITYNHELTHAFMSELHLDMVVSHEIEELLCLLSECVSREIARFVIANKKDFEKWVK